MNYLKHGKEIYDSIKIPEDYHQRVQNVLNPPPGTSPITPIPVSKNHLWGKWAAAAASLLFVVFVFTLNTNQAFALAAGNIPILGPIARILTIQTYSSADSDKTVSINQPGLLPDSGSTESQTEYIKTVNDAINDAISSYTQRAQKDIAEYKEAFLATGGTEEEFSKKNIHVKVDYEIKKQTDTTVSFLLNCTEDWNSSMAVSYYCNYDLQQGRPLTLLDLLGNDYISIANLSIQEQIKKQMADDNSIYYFSKNEGGFSSITNESHFYINESGHPVIVFEKYEIAPGYMGCPEFEILTN